MPNKNKFKGISQWRIDAYREDNPNITDEEILALEADRAERTKQQRKELESKGVILSNEKRQELLKTTVPKNDTINQILAGANKSVPRNNKGLDYDRGVAHRINEQLAKGSTTFADNLQFAIENQDRINKDDTHQVKNVIAASMIPFIETTLGAGGLGATMPYFTNAKWLTRIGKTLQNPYVRNTNMGINTLIDGYQAIDAKGKDIENNFDTAADGLSIAANLGAFNRYPWLKTTSNALGYASNIKDFSKGFINGVDQLAKYTTMKALGGKSKLQPNVIRGGQAIPLGNNFYYMQGRKHSQGGIDVGKDLEVEGGEVMQMGNKDIKVYSSLPLLHGKSPAQLVMGGVNPNQVFNAQESYKKRNRINDDGTKYNNGGHRKIARDMIISNEGFVTKSMLDAPKGKTWRSIGYGFNDSGFYSKYPGGISAYYDARGGITRAEAEQELAWVLDRNEVQLRKTYGKRWDSFNDNQKAAILDTQYQRPASVGKGSAFYNSVMRGDANPWVNLGVKGYKKRNTKRQTLATKGLVIAAPAKQNTVANIRVKENSNTNPQTTEAVTTEPVAPQDTQQVEQPVVQQQANVTPTNDIQTAVSDIQRRRLMSSYSPVNIKPININNIWTTKDNANIWNLKVNSPSIYNDKEENKFKFGGKMIYTLTTDKGSRAGYVHSTGKRTRANFGNDLQKAKEEGKKNVKQTTNNSVRVYNTPSRYITQRMLSIDSKNHISRSFPSFFNGIYSNSSNNSKNKQSKINTNNAKQTTNNSVRVYNTPSRYITQRMLSIDSKNHISRSFPGFFNGIYSNNTTDNKSVKNTSNNTSVKVQSTPANNKPTNTNNAPANKTSTRNTTTATRKRRAKVTPKNAVTHEQAVTAPVRTFVPMSNADILSSIRSTGNAEIKPKTFTDIELNTPIVTRIRSTGTAEIKPKTFTDIELNTPIVTRTKKDDERFDDERPYNRRDEMKNGGIKTYNAGTLDEVVITGKRPNNTNTLVNSLFIKNYLDNNLKYKKRNTVNLKTPTVTNKFAAGGRVKAKMGKKEVINMLKGIRGSDIAEPITATKTLADNDYTPPVGGSYILNELSRKIKNAQLQNEYKQQSDALDNNRNRSGIFAKNTPTDFASAGIGAAASIGSALINNRMLNKLKYTSQPVYKQATKLKTKYNINPQLDAINNTVGNINRNIDANTASSRIALSRKQNVMNNALANKNTLYGNKENQETTLINQDKLNRQNIRNSNIDTYNKWKEGETNFYNTIAEKKAENANSLLGNVNLIWQDLLSRPEKRDAEHNNLMAIVAANPNVSPRILKGLGFKGFTDEDVRRWENTYLNV